MNARNVGLRVERPPVVAEGEVEKFRAGDRVRIALRFPIGHYRVPRYVRGKVGVVDSVLSPRIVDNEEEGFGRSAGLRKTYYRIALRMRELWPEYSAGSSDQLVIEVIETWLERTET